MLKEKKFSWVLFYLFFAATSAYAENNRTNIRWPVPDWEVAENNALMESKQCQEFKKFSTENKKFLTDALLVIKDGQIQYEFYDSKYDVSKPHALWSVTKTITGALLGTAVRDGRITLEQGLSEFFPDENRGPNYNKILIKNLLYLDAGYVWSEGKLDVTDNPLVGMLYGKGHKDMVSFALQKKIISQGPSYKWNYSSGLPTVTMGVLKKVYGSSYEEMPWSNLFNPLGMKSTTFERDNSGTFVGGASFYSTPRDLAKLGYLYLNNGYWNGEILLPPEWIKIMLTPSPGYVSPGTVIKDIAEEGVYAGSLWLNRPIKKGFGRPYPYSPEDMYLARGHKGQVLIMLPSQNMIIVRTGYDNNFKSKLDAFVSRTLACFHDPNYKIAKVLPEKKISIGLGKILKNIKNILEANTLQSSIAKIVCSCHLVSGVDIPTCLKRNDFNFSKYITKIAVTENIELNGFISVQVKLSGLARLFRHNKSSGKAYYNPERPEFGCTLK